MQSRYHAPLKLLQICIARGSSKPGTKTPKIVRCMNRHACCMARLAMFRCAGLHRYYTIEPPWSEVMSRFRQKLKEVLHY
ncbi:predicted protein [Plenodomus lingam JN3]|uniref:Predicted protein n=1 Tax=Leptosphaeria maculans (strain JN3 / isolate v23.1.3 / race Av1-4-5-6-7-8) TaxID=985895 RepID=E5R502_LEPMJ|nr:predicted protein [Plenodomus lingam JN3]CBX92275.1 predicted protein [Plenodomus lingam JN3]